MPDTPKPVAVVAAMRLELAPLLRGVRSGSVDGVELYELPDAAVAIGGIGPEHARRAAEVAVQQFRPKRLLAAGIAGALSPKLKVGDVATVGAVIDAASGTRYATSDGGKWLLVSSAKITDSVEKQRLHATYGADVVDMEGAAIAQVAQQHGIEFAAIKSVSDAAEFEMPPIDRFIGKDGKLATGRFLLNGLVRPQWWSPLFELSRNSSIASKKLCEAVQHLLKSGWLY